MLTDALVIIWLFMMCLGIAFAGDDWHKDKQQVHYRKVKRNGRGENQKS